MFGLSSIDQLIGGHVALAACFALYLLWWWVFFWPRAQKPADALRIAGISGIVGAAVCGLLGLAMCIGAMFAIPSDACVIRPWHVAIGGMVGYLVLFFATAFVFDRQPTLELPIIAVWVTLELAVVVELLGAAAISGALALALVVLLVALAVISMACYIRFFHLEGRAAFVCGAIPLICAVAFAVVVALL